jgi:hypothetical protein
MDASPDKQVSNEPISLWVVDWEAWVSVADDWFKYCAWPVHFCQLLELTAHIIVSPDDETPFAAL